MTVSSVVHHVETPIGSRVRPFLLASSWLLLQFFGARGQAVRGRVNPSANGTARRLLHDRHEPVQATGAAVYTAEMGGPGAAAAS
jgi:N-methylhydantoinase B/oxoprolinase/acetone carboxylase alpha subunit